MIALAIGRPSPRPWREFEPVAERSSGSRLDENDGPVADDRGRGEAPDVTLKSGHRRELPWRIPQAGCRTAVP